MVAFLQIGAGIEHISEHGSNQQDTSTAGAAQRAFWCWRRVRAPHSEAAKGTKACKCTMYHNVLLPLPPVSAIICSGSGRSSEQ